MSGVNIGRSLEKSIFKPWTQAADKKATLQQNGLVSFRALSPGAEDIHAPFQVKVIV